MYETRLVQHQITSGFINIVADDHYLPAFWAHPAIGGVFPGLVLIHGWWGLTAHVRTQVRRFAELGFYVIAPDLFDGQTATTDEQGALLQKQLGEAGPSRVNAAVSALETHNRVNGKMGVVGWQMGGELAYHAAMHRRDLKAVIVFEGKPDDYLIMMPADETPILAFYGGQDPNISLEMIERVRKALAQSPGKGEIVVYPEASSGFFNDEMPTYRPEAAADAWGKLLDFLCDHMDIDQRRTPRTLHTDAEVI
jgi:carboxymethylenebutenolidase